MIATVHPRPLTSKLSPSQVSLVAFYSPATALDHLVHAWVALGSAVRSSRVEDERAHVEYARRRLECAASESVAASVGRRDRKAYEAEVESLKTALTSYVL